MYQLIISICFTLLLTACESKPERHQPNKTIQSSSGKAYNGALPMAAKPLILDSTNWVAFPLLLSDAELSEDGFSGGSYRSTGQPAYWNIAFYHSETKQNRLLSADLKMLILGITAREDLYLHPLQKVPGSAGILFYSIATNDLNQNGTLDKNDPKYLYVSTLSGQEFKQISPEGYDVLFWQPILKGQKLVIHARADSSKDKSFNSEDETVFFVYDLTTQSLEQVFDDTFQMNTRKLLESQWPKKK